MAGTLSAGSHPTVLLFDIGGVCVVSPMQAILEYEKSKGIPVGWVNTSISATNPDGAWQQLERGEIPLDKAFFAQFQADLSNEQRWRTFYAKHLARLSAKSGTTATAATESAYKVPPVPELDAEWLFWEMMRIARAPDPHMWPALQRLRQAADRSNGKLVLAALSNTVIFPPDHAFNDPSTPEGVQNRDLKGVFDLFISSAHVGMRKPEPEIYKYALTRLHEFVKLKGYGDGVRPSDVTFLDDIGSNLRTAKGLGIKTIRVQLGKADRAVAELEKITGLELTGGKAKL